MGIVDHSVVRAMYRSIQDPPLQRAVSAEVLQRVFGGCESMIAAMKVKKIIHINNRKRPLPGEHFMLLLAAVVCMEKRRHDS